MSRPTHNYAHSYESFVNNYGHSCPLSLDKLNFLLESCAIFLAEAARREDSFVNNFAETGRKRESNTLSRRDFSRIIARMRIEKSDVR
jgi:hypothetical protein